MNNPQIKVLVVTYLPWSNDISVGNTLSNIFKGMEDRIEFANIYFREDVPDNDIVERFFNISEKQLAKSIFARDDIGCEVNPVKGQKKIFLRGIIRLEVCDGIQCFLLRI